MFFSPFLLSYFNNFSRSMHHPSCSKAFNQLKLEQYQAEAEYIMFLFHNKKYPCNYRFFFIQNNFSMHLIHHQHMHNNIL